MAPVFHFDRAIAREPAPTVVNGISDAGGTPDYEALLAEHRAYVTALREAGVTVDLLPPLAAFPDSVFVEDPAFVIPEGAIVLRPGAASRAGEAAAIAPALEPHFGDLAMLQAGHVDGGDILILPDEILVGLSARTDRQGAEGFAQWARSLGRAVRIVATPPGVLHFKTGSSLVDERTVLATPEIAAAAPFGDLEVLVTSQGEHAAANVLRVNDRLLVSAGAPRTAAMLADRGLQLVPLATAEIEKIDAGLTCMSLRWRSA
jgi:dimethylargininase